MSAPLPEIWLSPRTDGNPGTGTETDPLDAHTATLFDGAMNSVLSGFVVRLAPGHYETHGVPMVDNRPIIGSGVGLTFVKLADNSAVAPIPPAPVDKTVFGASASNMQSGLVRDLTIDLNPDNQPIVKNGDLGSLNAIYMNAMHGIIENVRVLGPYANPGEGFPVVIGSDVLNSAAAPHFGRIRNVILENAKGYMTCVSIFYPGSTVSSYNTHVGNAIIEDCQILNSPGTTAFGAGGWISAKIQNNYCHDIATLVTQDTHLGYNVDILNNTVVDLSFAGCLINGGAGSGYPRYQAYRIAGNRFYAKAGEFPYLCALNMPDATVPAVVENNLLDCSASTLPNNYNPVAIVCPNAILRDNLFSKQDKMAFNSRVHLLETQVYGNRYTDGKPVYDLSFSSMLRELWRKEIPIAASTQGIIVLGEFDTYDAHAFDITVGATGPSYGGNTTSFRLNARSITDIILKQETCLSVSDFWQVCKKDLGGGVTMLAIRMNSSYVGTTPGTMTISYFGTPLRDTTGSTSGMTVITPS